MDEEFEILVAKILAGEASAQERDRLRYLLSQSSQLREEYAALESAWDAIQQAGPAAHALDAPQVTIPEARLRRLQAVVREVVSASGAPKGLPEPAHRPSERPTVANLVWQWLRDRTTRPSFAISAAVILVSLAGLVPLLLRQPTPKHELGEGVPLAFCLAAEGNAEVRRGDQLLPARLSTLQDGDELQMSSGSVLTLVTSNGITTLHGPQRLSSARLAGQTSAPFATNAPAATLKTTLFSPRRQLLGAGLLVTTRGVGAIRLYSPIGDTTSLTPLILWKTEPGKTYELLITDEFNPNTPTWRAHRVTSPVAFSSVEEWKGRALATNGLYRLRLSETDRPRTATEYTFRTLGPERVPASSNAAEKTLHAVQIMTSAPARLGDALAALLTLPPDYADAELALRLKLLVFGRLGYVDDFNATAAQLERLTQPVR